MNVSRVITLRKDEKIVRVIRSFWLAHLLRVLLGATLMTLAFFFMMPLFRFGWPGVVGFLLLVSLGGLYSLRALVVWYWNVFIVTNQRVVDVNQRGYFSREVSEANYEKIQDVLYSVSGIWRSLLNFGVVRLQTAGNGMALELKDVSSPKAVHHLITDSMSLYDRANNRGSSADKVAELLETVSGLSDAEAKAFLVSLQQAVDRGADDAARVIKSREEAIQDWVKDDDGDEEGVFKVDVAD
jgi:uncharacterized membrane protein YdbT with pleckstrin-like domain